MFGLPIHSPLSGEASEDTSPNKTSGNAQRLGNLLNTDRNAISVGGVLTSNGNTPDVDFYEFDISFLDPNRLPGGIAVTYPTVFDLDYANGLTDRPNASMQVYRLVNNNGTPEDPTDDIYELIYTARDGNIAEDRPATPGASDLQDMLRGSVGASDPFLGVVDLAIIDPPGRTVKSYPHATFRVAVSPDTWMPDEMDQFTAAVAANPNLRLEPIQTVRRIAEDHIEVGNPATSDAPQIPVLWDDTSEVAYHLGDVVLYLTRVGPASPSTTVLTVDPFTGEQETAMEYFPYDTGDVAMHRQRLAVFVPLVVEGQATGSVSPGCALRQLSVGQPAGRDGHDRAR